MPKTLKVHVPAAYGIHVGPPSMEVAARVSALEKQLLRDSIEGKKEKLVLAESELANPMQAFTNEYKELALVDKLPPELLGEAKAVLTAQGSVFKFAWIQAQAKLADKAEQTAATRTAAAEAQAQTSMEIEALPSRELIEDLVTRRVAAAVKELARVSTNASASAGSGNGGNAKAKAKAAPASAQGGASGSNKGKQKPKQNAKDPKNAPRK